MGVLTNSDDRVLSILSSLSLSVGAWRYGEESERTHRLTNDEHDIDLVALSYDVGAQKPDSRIFEATKHMVQTFIGKDPHCVHVGDDPKKDYRAALDAGWESVLLDRDAKHIDSGQKLCSSLTELGSLLEI